MHLKNIALAARRLSKINVANAHAEAVIGPEGGFIGVSAAGLLIQIPPGAVAQESRFRLAAHSSVHGFTVDMSPLQSLAVPAELSISLNHHEAELMPPNVVVGCTHMVDEESVCDEYFAVRREGTKLSAQLPHFSGYIVAVGDECDPTNPSPDCIPVDGI